MKAEQVQKDPDESSAEIHGDRELLIKVFDRFPYPLEIYAPDGTTVLVNKAMLDEYHIADEEMIVGKYNVFKDPYIIASGQLDRLKKAFGGETVVFSDIKVPLEYIVKRYGIKDLDLEAAYQDITVFPIPDDRKQVAYIAAVLVNRRVYRRKDEIGKAKEYIESHWMEKFSVDKTAKAACLSKAHLAKLFRKHTGMTPHEYYMNYKLSRLKEKLMDPNLTIKQAFAACNMEYSGNSAKLFRKKVGVSPSEYRKTVTGE